MLASALDAELRRLLVEAGALGVGLRLSGADIALTGRQPPTTLLNALGARRTDLWTLFGGPALDAPALNLLGQLGVEPVLVETADAADAAIDRLLADARSQPNYGSTRPVFGVDIETAPLPAYAKPRPSVRLRKDGSPSVGQHQHDDRADLDPHRALIATIQVYAGGDCCFVFRGGATTDRLRHLLLHGGRLVIHNAQFELRFLRRWWGAFPDDFECTMQAAGLLLGVRRRSLTEACSAYLVVDVPKGLQTSDWAAPRLSRGQVAYAAADAVLAYRLWRPMAEELRQKCRFAAYKLQRDAILPTADMELRGFAVDEQEHARHVQRWSTELADARRAFVDAAGMAPPSRPSEIRAYLRKALSAEQLTDWPCTETGELSTAREDLERFAHVPATRLLISIQALEKLLSNFGAMLRKSISAATGRIHASFNVAAAKSGRFTSSGPNLQQMPSKRDSQFKTSFVAAPGKRLVACDFSQIEMRAAAWISGDPAMTGVYAEGRDLHRENAAAIAGVPLDEVSKDQRSAAKPVGFGSIYGMGATGLSAAAWNGYGIEMSVTDAELALARFFTNYHGMKTWMRRQADWCRRRGVIEIGAGRVIEAAWEPEGELRYTLCVNAPIQRICADCAMRAMIGVYRDFATSGIAGGLVAVVHDELILEVPEEDTGRACVILESAMTRAFVETFPGAPTTGVASATIGHSWAEMK